MWFLHICKGANLHYLCKSANLHYMCKSANLYYVCKSVNLHSSFQIFLFFHSHHLQVSLPWPVLKQEETASYLWAQHWCINCGSTGWLSTSRTGSRGPSTSKRRIVTTNRIRANIGHFIAYLQHSFKIQQSIISVLLNHSVCSWTWH